MKPRPDFEQTADPPVNLGPASGRFGDPAQDLEQRGFSGAVPSDEADHFSMTYLQIYTLKCPKGLRLVPLEKCPWRGHCTRKRIAQRSVPLHFAERVELAQSFRTNRGAAHGVDTSPAVCTAAVSKWGSQKSRS